MLLNFALIQYPQVFLSHQMDLLELTRVANEGSDKSGQTQQHSWVFVPYFFVIPNFWMHHPVTSNSC